MNHQNLLLTTLLLLAPACGVGGTQDSHQPSTSNGGARARVAGGDAEPEIIKFRAATPPTGHAGPADLDVRGGDLWDVETLDDAGAGGALTTVDGLIIDIAPHSLETADGLP